MKPLSLPTFSVYEEVAKIVIEAGAEGVTSDMVVERLKREFPSYGITNKKVTNVLNYLKTRRKTIEGIGYGKYRASQHETTSSIESASD